MRVERPPRADPPGEGLECVRDAALDMHRLHDGRNGHRLRQPTDHSLSLTPFRCPLEAGERVVPEPVQPEPQDGEAVGLDGERCRVPRFSDVTRPAPSSTRRCWATAGRLTGSSAAMSPTGAGPVLADELQDPPPRRIAQGIEDPGFFVFFVSRHLP